MQVAAHWKKAGNEAGPEVVQSNTTKTRSEGPGALAGASGAIVEIAPFTGSEYTATALRVHHLCSRLPITADQATLLAGVLFVLVRA